LEGQRLEINVPTSSSFSSCCNWHYKEFEQYRYSWLHHFPIKVLSEWISPTEYINICVYYYEIFLVKIKRLTSWLWFDNVNQARLVIINQRIVATWSKQVWKCYLYGRVQLRQTRLCC
jgi:hypothetical protein